MFRTLADEGINLRLISTSPIKVSCLIPRVDVERAVRVAPRRLRARRGLGSGASVSAAERRHPSSAAAPPAESRPLGRASGSCSCVAGLLLLLSSFAIWINRVALNTGVFTDTSSSLLDDPAIRQRGREPRRRRAVRERRRAGRGREAASRTTTKGLAGPATAGLRQASYQIVDRALEQPAFQQLFKVTLEETHRTLVEVLEGGGERVSTENGEVTLDLRRDHRGGRRPDRDRRSRSPTRSPRTRAGS